MTWPLTDRLSVTGGVRYSRDEKLYRVSNTAGAGRDWTTVGVHPNVVEASWHALVDALTYGLDRARV